MSEQKTVGKRGKRPGLKDTMVVPASIFIDNGIKNVTVSRKWLEQVLKTLNLKLDFEPEDIVQVPMPTIVSAELEEEPKVKPYKLEEL